VKRHPVVKRQMNNALQISAGHAMVKSLLFDIQEGHHLYLHLFKGQRYSGFDREINNIFRL
jgi:hypothetical protein